MEKLKFSIAQGTGKEEKKKVPTFICKNEKWYRALMKRAEPICEEIEAEEDREEKRA